MSQPPPSISALSTLESVEIRIPARCDTGDERTRSFVALVAFLVLSFASIVAGKPAAVAVMVAVLVAGLLQSRSRLAPLRPVRIRVTHSQIGIEQPLYIGLLGRRVMAVTTHCEQFYSALEHPTRTGFRLVAEEKILLDIHLDVAAARWLADTIRTAARRPLVEQGDAEGGRGLVREP